MSLPKYVIVEYTICRVPNDIFVEQMTIHLKYTRIIVMFSSGPLKHFGGLFYR